MFLWLLTFYQTGPNGLFIFYQVFNLILQSAFKLFLIKRINLYSEIQKNKQLLTACLDEGILLMKLFYV